MFYLCLQAHSNDLLVFNMQPKSLLRWRFKFFFKQHTSDFLCVCLLWCVYVQVVFRCSCLVQKTDRAPVGCFAQTSVASAQTKNHGRCLTTEWEQRLAVTLIDENLHFILQFKGKTRDKNISDVWVWISCRKTKWLTKEVFWAKQKYIFLHFTFLS